MTATDFYEGMRQRFEGVIRCVCGNDDWRQFLYIQAGEEVIAGCKLCGRSYDETPNKRSMAE
jgi:hypothetical protein